MNLKLGTITTHSGVYHDSSTKGFRHGIRHKRHDCWRGDIKIMQKTENGWQMIKRIRKRFDNPQQAKAWIADNKKPQR